MRLRALLAALALTGTAAADEFTLLPAQPVAPTRTEQMRMAEFGLDGVPVTATGPGCPTDAATCEANRRRILDGTYRRTLCGVVDRFRTGVAMPLRCGCWASELTFFFGGCRSFYNPKWECNSCGVFGSGRFGPVQYGPGSRGTAPGCDTPPVTGFPTFR